MAGGPRILRLESQDQQSFKGGTLRGRRGGAAWKGAYGCKIEAWREEKRLRMTGERVTGGLRILRPDLQDQQSFKGRILQSREGGAARKGKHELGIKAWREEKGLKATGGTSGRLPLDA